MNAVRYEPWTLLNQLHREMDTMFRRDNDTASPVSDWTPAVDIQEADDAYVLHADIPGVNPADIDIQMEENVLTIRGKRTISHEDTKDNYKRVERVSGSFFRRFSLPDTADAENISAAADNGVLAVTIPKQAKPQPRKIEVQLSA